MYCNDIEIDNHTDINHFTVSNICYSRGIAITKEYENEEDLFSHDDPYHRLTMVLALLVIDIIFDIIMSYRRILLGNIIVIGSCEIRKLFHGS